MKFISTPVPMTLKNSSGLKMEVEYIIRRLTPENRFILENGLKLLGLERLRDLPGIADPNIIEYFIAGIKDLLVHHDPEYIFRYRQFYLNQLEYLATLI